MINRFLDDRRKDLSRVQSYLSPHVLRRLQTAMQHAEGVKESEVFATKASQVFRAIRDSSSPFPFPEIVYRKQLQNLNVQPAQESSFVEFLLLTALENIASLSADPKGSLFQEELAILHELFRQFPAEDHDHALQSESFNTNFPVDLPQHTLTLARELKIHPADIEEHFVRGSGHGGQKINKTNSCVELHHAPTNTNVRVQQFREQRKNRIAAYKLLIEKIEEQLKGKESKHAREVFKIRKQKARRSRKAKEKMLQDKKKRGDIKDARRKIS